ncbi:MAG: TRAP transporter substrate-binding protein DctP [Acidisphaera sp.]|nr:TRAP transporter substrate-binding protein DctP [Acidisphaera sp.]
MRHGLTRRQFGSAALAGVAYGSARSVRADEPLQLRCSLDTAPSHGRNISLGDYLKKVEAASNGRIKTELFASGQLFADLDVGKALVQGQVEMACPGSWTLTGFIPDADLFQLPSLYGQPAEIVHKIIDGPAGQAVANSIQQRLRSHVVGPWLDLGYSNWYTTAKPISTLADLKGMKIRNSGGAGQAWRARYVGAIPNTTAWPNVPLALSQGTFDGLVTTNESSASAKLWEAGVKYCLEDHQYFGEYVPMVSLTFWNKLSAGDQKMMTDLWAQNIGTYRANMGAAQTKARQTMESHGVKYVDPTPAQIADWRKGMVADQEQVAKELKIAPEVLKLVVADAGAAS